MTFVVTKVQAYGIEAEEALNKRYRQYMVLTLTAANTDVALDLGNNQTGSLGTFWTAGDDTATGAGALLALQDIVTRADYFDNIGGTFTQVAADATGTLITALNSSASTGGSATASFVLTGAATGDTVLGATIVTAATGTVALQSAASSIATANVYPVVFTGDPGSTAVIRVAISRASTAVSAGTYQLSFANKTPNILFVTGDAPTSYTVVLRWILKPQTAPVEYYAQA